MACCRKCGTKLPWFDQKKRGLFVMLLTGAEFLASVIFSRWVGWLLEAGFSTLPFLIIGWGMYAKGKAAPCPYCGNTPATRPAPASSAPADGAKPPANH